MACYKKQRSKNASLPISRYSFSLSNLSVTSITVRLGSGGITENQKKLQFFWWNPCVMPLKVQFNKCVFKSVISLGTMLCNQKRYCTGKPRYHNGFGVFSCPNFQVQTKRYFSLLRGLELPTPTISGGFWEMYSPESRLFSFPLKNYFLRSSINSKDDLPACSGKRFALHFRANLT